MKDEPLSFTVVQNYPAERKFIIRRPMRKSIKDSIKDMIMGKGR